MTWLWIFVSVLAAIAAFFVGYGLDWKECYAELRPMVANLIERISE